MPQLIAQIYLYRKSVLLKKGELLALLETGARPKIKNTLNFSKKTKTYLTYPLKKKKKLNLMF